METLFVRQRRNEVKGGLDRRDRTEGWRSGFVWTYREEAEGFRATFAFAVIPPKKSLRIIESRAGGFVNLENGRRAYVV